MDKRKRLKTINPDPVLRAYIIGVALGDGNLSNPNGRATRLRITCATAYPRLIESIVAALHAFLPENKVTIHEQRGNCVYISCYSNCWEHVLGWKAKAGSKAKQCIRVPPWIMRNRKAMISCLRGLIETDGSIYRDRGYPMVNFTSVIPTLTRDVIRIMHNLGFAPHAYTRKTNHRDKHVVRISKNVQEFVQLTHIHKT